MKKQEQVQEDVDPDSPEVQVATNGLLVRKILSNLRPSMITRCRLVNTEWKDAGMAVIRNSLKNRIPLCADDRCTANLQKLISVFKDKFSDIPFMKAVLILDHLPEKKTRSVPECGEMEMLRHLSELFFRKQGFGRHRREDYSPHSRSSNGHGHYSENIFKDIPPRGRNGETLKQAITLFGDQIENLILNMTLHTASVENMEYWLGNLKFPNLKELHIYITYDSPDHLNIGALEEFFDDLPKLRVLSIKKLTNQGEELLNAILLALSLKPKLEELKSLSLDIYTEEATHLELLMKADLRLEHLSLVYLEDEKSIMGRMDLIKQFVKKARKTLKVLHIQLPFFNVDYKNFPVMPNVEEIMVDRVYLEQIRQNAEIFGFDFHRFFPKLRSISFKDYDIWRNMDLKSFPAERMTRSPEVKELCLPDLCFDTPLMEKYFKKFPCLRKLSIVVSYVTRYQKQPTFCTLYSSQPQLKELHVVLLDFDVATCDDIFIGMNEETCKKLIRECREPKDDERGKSILMLRELEILKITSAYEKRILGITNRSVNFGFMKMASLKQFIVAPSLISLNGFKRMSAKFDVTILTNDIKTLSELGPVDKKSRRRTPKVPKF